MKDPNILGQLISELIEDAIKRTIGDQLQSIEDKLDSIVKMVTELYNERGEDQMLNKQQACKLLNISYPTLRGLIKKEIITPVLSGSKTIRFSRRSLLNALEKPELICIHNKIYRQRENRERVDKAKPHYVRGMIKKSAIAAKANLTVQEIPDELVELKRNQLLLKRTIKKTKT